MKRKSFCAQRSPDCGYCATDISVSEENMIEIVKSSKYQNQLKDKSFPKLANTFLCSSLIHEISGSYQSSAWRAIHAAWACDDFGLKDSAKSCRIKALSMIRKGESKGQSFMKSREESLCIQVDLLRRAERFKEASNLIKICFVSAKFGPLMIFSKRWFAYNKITQGDMHEYKEEARA